MAITSKLDFLRVILNAPDKTRFMLPRPGKSFVTRIVGQQNPVSATVIRNGVATNLIQDYGTPVTTRSVGGTTVTAVIVEGANSYTNTLVYDGVNYLLSIYAPEGFHVAPDPVCTWRATAAPVVFTGAWGVPACDQPYAFNNIDPLDAAFILGGTIDISYSLEPIIRYSLYRREDSTAFGAGDIFMRNIPATKRSLGLMYDDQIEIEAVKATDLTYYYKLTSFSAAQESPILDSPLRVVYSAEEDYLWATRKRLLGIQKIFNVIVPVLSNTWFSPFVVDFIKEIGTPVVAFMIEPDHDVEFKLNNKNNETTTLLGAGTHISPKDQLSVIRLLFRNKVALATNVKITVEA